MMLLQLIYIFLWPLALPCICLLGVVGGELWPRAAKLSALVAISASPLIYDQLLHHSDIVSGALVGHALAALVVAVGSTPALDARPLGSVQADENDWAEWRLWVRSRLPAAAGTQTLGCFTYNALLAARSLKRRPDAAGGV